MGLRICWWLDCLIDERPRFKVLWPSCWVLLLGDCLSSGVWLRGYLFRCSALPGFTLMDDFFLSGYFPVPTIRIVKGSKSNWATFNWTYAVAVAFTVGENVTLISIDPWPGITPLVGVTIIPGWGLIMTNSN
jgi:hypothetical protein